MEQNNSKKFMIVIGVVVLVALGAWLIVRVTSKDVGTYETENEQAPLAYNWSVNLGAVESGLKTKFSDVGRDRAVNVVSQADVTGDGINEAIVGLGAGGASVEYVALMRIKNGVPVPAQFKQQDGTINSPMFISGGSVMHSDDVRLDSEKQIVYTISTTTDGNTGLPATCAVTAYKWNAQTELFEYNRVQSEEYAILNCPADGMGK